MLKTNLDNGVVVHQVTQGQRLVSNLYCERPFCSADSRRFLYARQSAGEGPIKAHLGKKMNIRALKENEKEELYDLLDRSYPGNRRDFFKQRAENDPGFSLEMNRVLEVDGKLAARICIHDREMYFKGDKLRVGAIGGVCTDPAHRGKGYAKMLLEDCTRHMQKNGFDISLLFGEPIIYGGSGWQTLVSFGMKTNFKLARSGNTRQVPATDLEGLSGHLSALYDRSNAGLNGPFLRSKSYWNTWIKTKISSGRGIIRVCPAAWSSAPAGYYVASDPNTITELCYTDPATLAELMGSVFKHADPEKEITFSFFSREAFDCVCGNSVAPTLDDTRHREYSIRKTALYSGLFKLINNAHGSLKGVRDTAELIALLRNNQYTFWGLDLF